MRSLYIVTYDVSDPKRLRNVFRIMRGYGDHIQLSVFRCELSDRERVELTAKLTEIIKHTEDQVLLFRMGPATLVEEDVVYSIGRPYQPSSHGAVVI